MIFPPSVFHHNDSRAEEAPIISSSPHQAVDQAAALRPTQGQGGPPLPVPPHDISPSPNQVVDQAAASDPALGQGGGPRARPVHVLGGQPCNVSPSPHQVVNLATVLWPTKDQGHQGGALCPGLSYVNNPHPALPPPHLPLLQPSEQGGQSPDVAAASVLPSPLPTRSIPSFLSLTLLLSLPVLHPNEAYLQGRGGAPCPQPERQSGQPPTSSPVPPSFVSLRLNLPRILYPYTLLPYYPQEELEEQLLLAD